jgi:hypothetical protein
VSGLVILGRNHVIREFWNDWRVFGRNYAESILHQNQVLNTFSYDVSDLSYWIKIIRKQDEYDWIGVIGGSFLSS